MHRTDAGLRMMLRRRGSQVGLPGLHAYQLRHACPMRGSPKAAPRPI